MTEQSVRDNDAKDMSQTRPYAPSWVDHLTAWVDRRSWSRWYIYLGLWVILVSLQVAALWLEGVHPTGTVFPAQVFIPTMIILFLAGIDFLDSRSGAALETLRPALRTDEEEYELLRFQLTTLPAMPTVVASLATMAGVFLLGLVTGIRESSLEALGTSPIAANLLSVAYYLGWWVFGTFLYHTIHQLRVIDRIYDKHTRVGLFALSPLYAFSIVTALTAVMLAVATYGWTILNPGNLTQLTSVVLVALITVLALAVFAWPLLGTRRLLAKEKGRRLDEVSVRIETTFAQMHQRIDDGEIGELDSLTKVVSVLESERDTLKAISTWPWQPDTLRVLATALLLPLLLWIVQFILQQVLGS